MSIRILVLCRGNITRSPFMAGYLHHLYKSSDIFDKVQLDIDSSGIEGKDNMHVHPEVLRKGHEIGFDLELYRSKHSDYKAFSESDLILVVKKSQYSRFEKNFPNLLYKVFHLYEFGRPGNIELIDFEDPSQGRSKISFEDFFNFSITELERVWNFIQSTIEEALAEGKPVDASLFQKPEDKSLTFLHGYNFLTKRFKPVCPKCQSRRIRRDKRFGFLQKEVFTRLNGFPYHCGSCRKKFILFIGSEIESRHKTERQLEKWKKFMEDDKKANEAENHV